MSDLISRQDAIRWVKTECNLYGKPTLDFESGKRVIEHLKQMPPAQPEDKCSECDAWNKYKNYRYPQWIPVTERLPEAAIDVLVCNDDQKQAVAIMQTQDFYGHTMKEWYIKYCLYDWDVWDEDADGKIVAWMPLPEPYKEGQDERSDQP